jgi:hypothetical protein
MEYSLILLEQTFLTNFIKIWLKKSKTEYGLIFSELMTIVSQTKWVLFLREYMSSIINGLMMILLNMLAILLIYKKINWDSSMVRVKLWHISIICKKKNCKMKMVTIRLISYSIKIMSYTLCCYKWYLLMNQTNNQISNSKYLDQTRYSAWIIRFI